MRPIAGAIGAEISGVDLSKELDDDTVAAIRRAWLDHNVIFFRDQDLPPARFLTFARRFGKVVEYPFIKGLEEFPEIIPVIKLEHEKTNFGGIWHSDTSYLEEPPMGTMLVARETPPAGGDTMFANTYLAYEALSDGMKRMLDGLIGINTSAKADASRTREDRVKQSVRDDAKKEYVGEHPVVRTHPETGRKALYVNVGHTLRFKDMDGGGEPRRSSTSCSSTRRGPSSPAASAGSPARWPSGTTAARCTTPSTTITAIAASCTASRWPATSRASSPGSDRRVGRIAEAPAHIAAHQPHQRPDDERRQQADQQQQDRFRPELADQRRVARRWRISAANNRAVRRAHPERSAPGARGSRTSPGDRH